MFLVGCIFVDHPSGFMSIKHQVDINDTENFKGKTNLLGGGVKVREWCINMSCHALMGRPSTRLETMALVKLMYVLV